IKSFRHLAIAFVALGPQYSRKGADTVVFYERIFGSVVITRPKLHIITGFKTSDVNIFAGILQAFRFEQLGKHIVIRHPRLAHPVEGKLKIPEGRDIILCERTETKTHHEGKRTKSFIENRHSNQLLEYEGIRLVAQI